MLSNFGLTNLRQAFLRAERTKTVSSTVVFASQNYTSTYISNPIVKVFSIIREYQFHSNTFRPRLVKLTLVTTWSLYWPSKTGRYGALVSLQFQRQKNEERRELTWQFITAWRLFAQDDVGFRHGAPVTRNSLHYLAYCNKKLHPGSALHPLHSSVVLCFFGR